MKKTYLLFLLTIAMISSKSFAHYPIGESEWNFESDQEASYNLLESNQGVNPGCNSFQIDTAPESFQTAPVSFEISYKYKKPGIDIDNNGSKTEINEVSEDGYSKIVLKNISKLDISFLVGGDYVIKNITGRKVFSNSCDIGFL